MTSGIPFDGEDAGWLCAIAGAAIATANAPTDALLRSFNIWIIPLFVFLPSAGRGVPKHHQALQPPLKRQLLRMDMNSDPLFATRIKVVFPDEMFDDEMKMWPNQMDSEGYDNNLAP